MSTQVGTEHQRDFKPPSNAAVRRNKRKSESIGKWATHERGGMRVAQGSPSEAGAGLLEQVLLPPFGDKPLAAQNSRRLARRASEASNTKGGRVRGAARYQKLSARSAQTQKKGECAPPRAFKTHLREALKNKNRARKKRPATRVSNRVFSSPPCGPSVVHAGSAEASSDNLSRRNVRYADARPPCSPPRVRRRSRRCGPARNPAPCRHARKVPS